MDTKYQPLTWSVIVPSDASDEVAMMGALESCVNGRGCTDEEIARAVRWLARKYGTPATPAFSP
jgi:hypothetical protein